MIGRTISHYKIVEQLGEGGMGVVYKAEDLRLRRPVALKFLPTILTRESQARERFIHEARAASALDHPNICTIHEIDETEDGQSFICMAFYDGESLRERVERGPLPLGEAVDTAMALADGLARAHDSDIVHRDIKPGNIMITDRDEVKIVDFGLAKLAGQTRLTKIGTTVGTLAYMSPEQAQGRGVDARTDVWSLGVVLYEMLTGRSPFESDFDRAVLYSIANVDPQPVSEIREGVPGGLQRIVEKAMAKEADLRYQTAGEMRDELRQFKESGVSGAAHPPRSSRRRLNAVVAGFLSLAVIAAGYLLYTRVLTPDDPANRPATETTPGAKAPLSSLPALPEFDQSIAVLPFEDISPNGDNEYFSDGLTDELITDLSQVRSLRVISRRSVMKLKGTEKDVREIGQTLAVRYVLEGSIRKAGNDLRINAKLIDTTTDSNVWAEKYGGTLEDVFDIQENVSRAIVGALKVTLSVDEDRIIRRRAIDNVRAYEYYLRAKQETNRATEDGLERSLALLEDGEDIVGENALLYTGKGFVYWQYVNVGLRPKEEYLPLVRQCAEKIFELEPESASGHYLLGLLAMIDGNLQEGTDHFRRTLVRDPNNLDALRYLVAIYGFSGKVAAARPLDERSARLDPLSTSQGIRTGMLSWMEGRFDLAIEDIGKVYERRPEHYANLVFYSWALAYNGRLDEAYTTIDKLVAKSPGHFLSRLCLFLKYAWQGKRTEALQLITPDLEATARGDYQYAWLVAVGHAVLNERDQAVEWLQSAVDGGFINYPYFAEYDPYLENIRGEQSFEALMGSVKDKWERFDA